jgi:hypothetical protein
MVIAVGVSKHNTARQPGSQGPGCLVLYCSTAQHCPALHQRGLVCQASVHSRSDHCHVPGQEWLHCLVYRGMTYIIMWAALYMCYLCCVAAGDPSFLPLPCPCVRALQTWCSAAVSAT